MTKIRIRGLRTAACLALALCATGVAVTPAAGAQPGVYEAREQDWRNGAIVYQVLVDRFAPSANLEAKRALYPAPKVLRGWHEMPKRGRYLDEARVWSHEIEFWGGDLASLAGRLDYVHRLGVDVLYLNPIHLAYTNHKYDALDYNAVSPEFGTRDDVRKLAQDVHARGMKLVLDGVFNHMGRNSPAFQHAASSPGSPYRDWFFFDAKYPDGARVWAGARNLPELKLEAPAVRDHVYGAHDSVVRSYLRDGIDGWRLDVAFDMGFHILKALTLAAHQEKPGSLIVGELWNYPKEWLASVDGVMNFTVRELILRTVGGTIDGRTANRMLERVIVDAGIEPMLKSWLMLDNHDTERLVTLLPDVRRRRMAQVLQFTLPAAPNLYYGSELGMSGGDDPEMRAPMRWDLVKDDNATLHWTRKLVQLRRDNRALRIGDYRAVESGSLLAFERHTDRVADTRIIVANPGTRKVTDQLLIANSSLMNSTLLHDLIDEERTPIAVRAGMVTITLAPGEIVVLRPDVAESGGYTPYKRVQ